MEIIKLIGIGIILGVANVIPGVSGGTLAVVFNVYDRLLGVITLNVKKILSEWKFVLPLGGGMAAGIILFSKLIAFLFARYPVQTNWFFIGIIAGSIPMIYKRLLGAAKTGEPGAVRPAADADRLRATRRSPEKNGVRLPAVSAIVCCAAALALMIVLTYTDAAEAGGVIRTDFSFTLALRLFFALALAAVAMIIPGISGSFLMLVLGVYGTIIAAVADMNIPLLIPAALGAIAGLLGGAGLVRFLLAKVPAQTYGAIFGLILGSVFVIFPGCGTPAVFAVSLVCAAAGFCVSFFASREK